MRLDWHEDFIIHLAKIVRPKVYVELGIYHCSLLNRMIPIARQIYGVDINPEAENYLIKSSNVQFYCGSTQKFAEELKVHPLKIDMLFIDADHSKEAVLQDFKDFFPYVIPHGLIVLHDTHPGSDYYKQSEWCGTAYEAVAELAKKTEAYEMMTIPVSPGLTLCRKRQTQLSWEE